MWNTRWTKYWLHQPMTQDFGDKLFSVSKFGASRPARYKSKKFASMIIKRERNNFKQKEQWKGNINWRTASSFTKMEKHGENGEASSTRNYK